MGMNPTKYLLARKLFFDFRVAKIPGFMGKGEGGRGCLAMLGLDEALYNDIGFAK